MIIIFMLVSIKVASGQAGHTRADVSKPAEIYLPNMSCFWPKASVQWDVPGTSPLGGEFITLSWKSSPVSGHSVHQLHITRGRSASHYTLWAFLNL